MFCCNCIFAFWKNKSLFKDFHVYLFKCLLIMTDCCFLFYLTKRENNISCTINLYKKSRNAGATTFENQYQNTCILRKIKEIDCVVVIINAYNNWYYNIIYINWIKYLVRARPLMLGQLVPPSWYFVYNVVTFLMYLISPGISILCLVAHIHYLASIRSYTSWYNAFSKHVPITFLSIERILKIET